VPETRYSIIADGPRGPRGRRGRRRARRVRLIVSTLVLLALAVLIRSVVIWIAPGPPVGRPAVLGVYAGYTNVKGVAAFSRSLGFRVDQAMEFLDGTSWQTIVKSPANEVPIWSRTRYRMTWGIPILPNQGATLHVGATGAYDGYFESVARYLVAHGQGRSVIRLGWEFNGDWFRWSASGCPSCFISYWRHIVTTMRAVPGGRFLFEWNPAAGRNSLAPPAAYPGNRYVDIIGLDVYDNVPHVVQPAARWRDLVREPFGLRWVQSFARSHRKPVSFPEWGLGYPPAGGGDNAYFVSHMARFVLSQHHADNAIYWDYGTSTLSSSPRSLAALVRVFR